MGKLGTHGARQPKAPKVKSKLQAGLPSASSSNDAALRLKLEELTGGVDPETDDKAWVEALVVTSDKPLECDDPDDDLKRELAFYNQALDAVRAHEMHAVFVQSLTELSKVVVEEKREPWALFLGQIVSLLREDMASTPSSQWKIGRAIRPLSAEAVSLCQTDPRTTSSDLFRRMTDVQETTIPQLQAHLETVLHNHLLKMRGS